jgi:hypothetical protein
MTRARDTANTQENIGGSVAPFVAGKNKIINGDFAINQRAFTTYTTGVDVYNFDRFVSTTNGDGTVTWSPQANATGNVPGTPYQMRNFLRCVTTGQTSVNARAAIGQRIEGIETLAGQTVTISFWAKSATGTPKIAVEFLQRGDASTNTYAGQVTINTSWTRYSVSVATPSLSGVTLTQTGFVVPFFNFSASSDYNSRTGSLGIQSNTFDIWGIQLEAGSVATPFTTASGSIGGELALCQRYYFRRTGTFGSVGSGFANSTTVAYINMNFPVPMRITPSAVDTTGTVLLIWQGGGYNTISSYAIGNLDTLGGNLQATSSGLTAGYSIQLAFSNAGSIGFSAEL